MFEPYHKFKHCQRLRKRIRILQENNNITENILANHHKYHYALIHKMKSTLFYYENIVSVINSFSDTNITGFLFSVNRNLDAFFHCGAGALDILAREVLTYYGIPFPHNVYFRTARNELTQQRPNDPIIDHLRDPIWKTDFTNYKNACTHELLIADSISINITTLGDTPTKEIIVPLPDDPRCNPNVRAYQKYPNILEYGQITLKRLLSLINVVYGDLADKMTTNNRLPL